MLDIKFIRDNVDAVKTAIQNKRVNLNLDELLHIDGQVLELKKKLQALGGTPGPGRNPSIS